MSCARAGRRRRRRRSSRTVDAVTASVIARCRADTSAVVRQTLRHSTRRLCRRNVPPPGATRVCRQRHRSPPTPTDPPLPRSFSVATGHRWDPTEYESRWPCNGSVLCVPVGMSSAEISVTLCRPADVPAGLGFSLLSIADCPPVIYDLIENTPAAECSQVRPTRERYARLPDTQTHTPRTVVRFLRQNSVEFHPVRRVTGRAGKVPVRRCFDPRRTTHPFRLFSTVKILPFFRQTPQTKFFRAQIIRPDVSRVKTCDPSP